MQEQHTDTEESLEQTYGVEATLPYALRADQLADGTYRYALEDVNAGRVLAEGAHADDEEALARFRRSLAQSGLSAPEMEALQQALRQHDSRS